MDKYEQIWNESRDIFKHNMPDCALIQISDVVNIMEGVEKKLKPRYKVEKEQDWYMVIDKETPEDDWGTNQVVTFYNHKSIDARAEALKLCKQLNEKD